jgi:transcription termination/antitermination protein NusG
MLQIKKPDSESDSPDQELLHGDGDAGGHRWYAVYTNAHHEKRVERQLIRHGIESFLPVYKSVRRWKDRRKLLELPLFPGYVFVHVALRARTQVLQLHGVVEFVSCGSRPVPLADVEIDSLRDGLHFACAQPHPYFRVGRRVRIRSGPLTGVEGMLVRRKDQVRVVLSIHLIQRSIAVEVDQEAIELVN